MDPNPAMTDPHDGAEPHADGIATARAEVRPRRARRRKPGPFPVVATSVAAFTGLFGFLMFQMRNGHDPALGAPAASVSPAVKRVVVKRIERRVIVTKLLPARRPRPQPQPVPAAAPPAAAAPVASAPAAQPVVVQRAPAPAPVQQAPAPAPTPAPVPAPAVTRSS
jgi:hypothetical protein